VDEINEMKQDYHHLFNVGKSLKVFCNELQMEPLFTKSDLLIRRNIISSLKAVSGKYTAKMNSLMTELKYCIDQRLAQIEKYLSLEKGKDQSGNRGCSRRGATMAGCLDLNITSLFKGNEALDSTLGFSEGTSTQASKGRATFLSNGRRNTFAKNLDIFKVTRSDCEDSEYFDDSDNEMLIDMENILKHSRKLKSKGSFELQSMEFMTAGSKEKSDSNKRFRSNKSFHELGTQF